MRYSVLLVGGDRRQTFLARCMAEPGRGAAAGSRAPERVDTLAVPGLPDTARPEPYALVILPCPCLGAGGRLRGAGEGLPLSALAPFLGPETRLCCGAPGAAAEALRSRCACLFDLLEDPAVAADNARLTAEAALILAEQTLEASVADLRVAVLGWGRIGRRLAELLLAHGAMVSAAARRRESRAEAAAAGCESCDFPELGGGFDLVCNTVPARTLTEAQLQKLGDGCVWMELASAPGGLPDPAPEHLRLLPAGSLPGKILPRSAAEVLFAGILRHEAGAPEDRVR